MDKDSNSFSSEISLNTAKKINNRDITKTDDQMFLSCQTHSQDPHVPNMLREATKHEKAYKIIIDYLNDIMIVKKEEIVLPRDLLVDIIKILTNCHEVIIRFDYDVGCCGSIRDISVINNIIIITNSKDRSGVDFGLGFPQVASFLHQCNINFNFVRNLPPKKK